MEFQPRLAMSMALSLLTLGPVHTFAAPAYADPGPGVPGVPGYGDPSELPPDVPPPSTIGSPLAQSTGPAGGPAGLPAALPDLSGNAANEFVLAQNPAPAVPSGAPPENAVVPNLNPLNNQYMLPRNTKPAAPGQGQLYDVAPGDENADNTKTQYLQHLWHGYQDGMWQGTLVGRRPKAELNEPLPGTAPPPGTRIPGLGDDSQGPPPEQWHWAPPEPPEGAAPAAPGTPPVPPAPPVPAPPA